MRTVLAILLALLFTGCCADRVITKPVRVEVVRNVVQPVPRELTEPLPIATGDLAECPTVAAQRKSALETCNARLRAIRERE